MNSSNSIPEPNSTYNLYLVVKDKQDYLISACGFVSTSTIDKYIFQMLKDTHFSMIRYPTDGCELEIVFIKNIKSNDKNKLAILDYYNNTSRDVTMNVKPIIKFNCDHIGDHIELGMFTLTNDTKIKNIELQFFVNNYQDKLHISNPYFSITKNDLNNLIK
jgi:hypothetical protein